MDEFSSISDILGKRQYLFSGKKTERGEILKSFAEKLGWFDSKGKPAIGRVARAVQGIPTGDLYYIQKQCDSYKGPWAKAFHGMMKPR